MEQLVLLLIIGLISLINWLMQRSAEMREKRKLEKARQEQGGEPVVMARRDQGPSVEEPDGPAEDPSEAMRKLMEALGVPMEEAPPPRREPPPLPQAQKTPQPPVLLPEEPAFVPPSPDPVFEPPNKPPAPLVPGEAVSVARSVRRPKKVAVAEVQKPSRLRELLSSQSGLRDAVVLAEILGPPRSLR